MNKRVLIIVQNLPVPFDRRVWQEAVTLKENGYLVSVICPKGRNFSTSYECMRGIHIYRYPPLLEAKSALGYFAEYAWALLCQFHLAVRIYFVHGFAVIHACNPPDTIFLIGGLFKFLLGKKFIFDHHDINPELYEAKFGRRGFFHRTLLLCEQLTFRLADISIATNNSYQEIAVERGRMKPENVFVVRSGPDLERMQIMEPVPALKHGKQYLVGYVGVMGKQEGIEYLLAAACHIVRDLKRTDIHFTLVGDGTELMHLKNIAASKHISAFINFTGRIPDNDLLAILSTADVCVNPDEVNPMNDKSTMNKIMEYMALGKPIVQFDVTEGKFSAQDASLYAKPNDAADFAAKIIELIDDPEKRATMGGIGRARIENELAWKYEVPKLLAAYGKLFAGDSLYEKYAWCFHRLGAMSPPEILHRVIEQVKRKIDCYHPSLPGEKDHGGLPVIPLLREKLKAWQAPQPLLLQWENLREQAYAGNFFLLGQTWPQCGAHEKWHLDPVTGKSWPANRYCFVINFRHQNKYGDVKYVWEMNRLQYLQPLAALAFMQNDGKLATFCANEIESWIDRNPPYLGINWASGIELALRVISIMIVMTLLTEHITAAQRIKIWKTIEAHALWIERYPSRYSSANNHKAAEGLGLFLIGALCPALARAGHWKKQGWKMLCESAHDLILPDGTGAEQAISYTAFILDILMFGKRIAETSVRAHGETQVTSPYKKNLIPDYYSGRLALCSEYLRWCTDMNGTYPRIGDDDEGKVLEEHLGQIILDTPLTPAPPSGMKTFPDGGHTLWRYNTNGKEILLAMDHGALGYSSIAAHGHADSLAIWLHIDGQPVLVDAGTYLYHSGGEWRTYFRGTAAHNTLCVEKTDSSTMAGHFNWSHKAHAELIKNTCENGFWKVEAEHDGYKRTFGTIHRRALQVMPGRGFEVQDVLLGGKILYAEIGFLIHPALEIERHGDSIYIKKGKNIFLRISHKSPLSFSLENAWHSPRFGEKEKASRIVFSGFLQPEQKAVTSFYY